MQCAKSSLEVQEGSLHLQLTSKSDDSIRTQCSREEAPYNTSRRTLELAQRNVSSAFSSGAVSRFTGHRLLQGHSFGIFGQLTIHFVRDLFTCPIVRVFESHGPANSVS